MNDDLQRFYSRAWLITAILAVVAGLLGETLEGTLYFLAAFYFLEQKAKLK